MARKTGQMGHPPGPIGPEVPIGTSLGILSDNERIAQYAIGRVSLFRWLYFPVYLLLLKCPYQFTRSGLISYFGP